MAIDKAESDILGQIKKLPQGVEIEKIRDSLKLSFLAGKLVDQKADVEKVSVASEIKENRTFSTEEVAKLIVIHAMGSGLELGNLKLTKIIRDKQGRLLIFEAELPNAEGGNQLFSYIIKGKHDRNQSGSTAIDRTFWDKDDMPDGPGGIIAEFHDRKWHFES